MKLQKSWTSQTAKQGKNSAKFPEISANLRQIYEKLDLEKEFYSKKFFFCSQHVSV